MILHTVNKPPASHACLRDCLNLAAQGSGILLLEDGVLGAIDTTENRKLLQNAINKHKLYVLGPDLNARGLAARVMPEFEVVEYAGFVELCARYSKVQNWY